MIFFSKDEHRSIYLFPKQVHLHIVSLILESKVSSQYILCCKSLVNRLLKVIFKDSNTEIYCHLQIQYNMLIKRFVAFLKLFL